MCKIEREKIFIINQYKKRNYKKIRNILVNK